MRVSQDEFAGGGVDAVDEIVGAEGDDFVVVDGDVAVLERGAGEPAGDVVGDGALVFPGEIAGGGVEGLQDIRGIRQVHHAFMDQRRGFLDAGGHAAGPDHAQGGDVRLVDLVERAVAPAVEGAAPHEPVGWVGVFQHFVGDGDYLGEGGGGE